MIQNKSFVLPNKHPLCYLGMDSNATTVIVTGKTVFAVANNADLYGPNSEVQFSLGEKSEVVHCFTFNASMYGPMVQNV